MREGTHTPAHALRALPPMPALTQRALTLLSLWTPRATPPACSRCLLIHSARHASCLLTLPAHTQCVPPLLPAHTQEALFSFNRVFGPSASQQAVYQGVH